jgi:hypothetical protein
MEIDGIGEGYAKSIRGFCGLKTVVAVEAKTIDEIIDSL